MYVIWHDTDYDLALWFYEHSVLRKKGGVTIQSLPSTITPKSISALVGEDGGKEILPLLRYETPDIIVEEVGAPDERSRPLLAVEFMTHTPQWQHPMQRFARIYGSAFCGVPVGMVLPRTKVKFERRGDDYVEVTYQCSPSVYSVFLRLSTLSGTPACIFHWPDKDGHLRVDSTRPNSPRVEGDIAAMFALLERIIEDAENGLDPEERSVSLAKDTGVRKTLSVMDSLAGAPEAATFGTLEGTQRTEDLLTMHHLAPPSWSGFKAREECIVFAPDGLHPPRSKFRTDPYAGMLCAFDILFCRDGNGRRVRNLVFRAKNVKRSYAKGFSTSKDLEDEHENGECPFRDLSTSNATTVAEVRAHVTRWCPCTASKHRRIYGQVSDLILFDDAEFWGGGGR